MAWNFVNLLTLRQKLSVGTGVLAVYGAYVRYQLERGRNGLLLEETIGLKHYAKGIEIKMDLLSKQKERLQAYNRILKEESDEYQTVILKKDELLNTYSEENRKLRHELALKGKEALENKHFMETIKEEILIM